MLDEQVSTDSSSDIIFKFKAAFGVLIRCFTNMSVLL